jgi:hypothetical protein
MSVFFLEDMTWALVMSRSRERKIRKKAREREARESAKDRESRE